MVKTGTTTTSETFYSGSSKVLSIPNSCTKISIKMVGGGGGGGGAAVSKGWALFQGDTWTERGGGGGGSGAIVSTYRYFDPAEQRPTNIKFDFIHSQGTGGTGVYKEFDAAIADGGEDGCSISLSVGDRLLCTVGGGKGGQGAYADHIQGTGSGAGGAKGSYAVDRSAFRANNFVLSDYSHGSAGEGADGSVGGIGGSSTDSYGGSGGKVGSPSNSHQPNNGSGGSLGYVYVEYTHSYSELEIYTEYGGTINGTQDTSFSTNVYYGDSYTVTVAAKDGYEFDGWSDGDPSGTTRVFTAPFSSVYIAKFKPRKYAIIYKDSNGAVLDNTTYTYTYSPNSTTSLSYSPTKANCNFYAWYTTYNGGGYPTGRTNAVPAGTIGDYTVYAGWTGKKHKIVFSWVRPDNNNITINGVTKTADGNVELECQYNPYGASTVITAPTAVTANASVYVFSNWNTRFDGTGDKYVANSTFNVYDDGTVTYYAQFFTCALTIVADMKVLSDEVSSTVNNGVVNVRPGASTTLTIGTDFWVNIGTPTKTYGDGTTRLYQFAYWTTTNYNLNTVSSTSPPTEATTITVSPAATATTHRIVLYAYWFYKYKLKVSYNANAASSELDDGSVPTTDTIVSTNQYPNVAYNYNTNGGYAVKFSPLPIHKNVDIGGESQQVQFLGWASDPTLTTPTYTSSGTNKFVVGPSGAYPWGTNRNTGITLFAIWTGSYIVKFDPNRAYAGGSVGTIYMEIGGENYTLSVDSDNPEITTSAAGYIPTGIYKAELGGYYFKGWNTAPDGSGTAVADDGTGIQITANEVILYAQWQQVYYITFNGNGIPFESTVYPTNGDRKLDKLPKLKDSSTYKIVGWFLSPVDGSQVYSEEDHAADPSHTAYMFSGNSMVYLHWVSVYEISFDTRGGNKISPMTTDFSGRLTTYPTAFRGGYSHITGATEENTLTGWWMNETQEISSEHVFSENTTLFARWTPIKYTITFDYGEGSGSETEWTDVTFGMPYGYESATGNMREFPLPETAPADKSFIGWGYQSGASGSIISASDIFNDLDHLRLYALWENGGFTVTFNPMGGSVAPVRSLTNKVTGTLKFYPVPKRTGFRSVGWYNWPILNTVMGLQGMSAIQIDEALSEYYRNNMGLNSNAPIVNGALIVNTSDEWQYRYETGENEGWKDATGRTFVTYYNSTDKTIEVTDGQSLTLNEIYQAYVDGRGWVLVDSGTVNFPSDKKSFNSYEDLLYYTEETPYNNDIASVKQSNTVFYYRFTILDGVTLVLRRTDPMNDVAYTWTKDTSAAHGGSWANTTGEWDTVILPSYKYVADSTVYAHWVETPYNDVHGNVCYIERRLNRNTDDTVRLYLPTITSIDDNINVSLTQKDTLLFGYENKFVMDLGTTQSYTVSVMRVNPKRYNDRSQDPAEWSNGKWFNTFKDFTNYWQNFGRDSVTGSMIGGFRFHYEPQTQQNDDDRVDYGNLYPIIDKNVSIRGNIDAEFTDTVLKFSMTLAVGQMISDENTSGYRNMFYYDNNKKDHFSTHTPDGLDLVLPNVPESWSAPEGKMFSGWSYNSVTYAPLSVIPWSKDSKNISFVAQWDNVAAGIVFKWDSYDEVAIDTFFKEVESLGEGKYRMKALKSMLLDCTLIGGGGGGACGKQIDEQINYGSEWWQEAGAAIANTAISIFGLQGKVTQTWVTSGGGGGAGEIIKRSLLIVADDTIEIEIGKGGDAGSPTTSGFTGGGSDGNLGKETVLYLNSTKLFTANPGSGGSNSGTGGQAYSRGGRGNDRNREQTNGHTAASGERGIVGIKGETTNTAEIRPTVWYGGGGGGACGYNTRYKIGNSYLPSEGYYVSKGGNGAGNGNDAPSSGEGAPQFGGGGGGGCGKRLYPMGGGNDKILHRPSSGAAGLVAINVKVV